MEMEMMVVHQIIARMEARHSQEMVLHLSEEECEDKVVRRLVFGAEAEVPTMAAAHHSESLMVILVPLLDSWTGHHHLGQTDQGTGLAEMICVADITEYSLEDEVVDHLAGGVPWVAVVEV